MLPVERKRPVFEMRPMQFPSRDPRSCVKIKNTLPPRLLSHPCHEVEVCRGKEVSEAKGNHGSFLRQPCRYFLKVPARDRLVNIGIRPSAKSIKNGTGCKAGDKCLFAHCKVDEQPNKKAPKERLPKKKRQRRQESCGFCEKCTSVGLCLARLGCVGFSKRQTVPKKPDATSLGINLKSTVHSVHAASSKYPGKERTVAWKNTSQTSSSAKSVRYEI